MDKISWITVYPEIVLLVMACVIALVDLGVHSPRRTATYVLTLLSLAVVAVLYGVYASGSTTLYEKLGDRVGRDIFFYSISIEPERDTPQRLKGYAEAFRAGPGWLFLTGLPEDIKTIRYKFGDRRPALADHRNDVVLGNGRTGEWQRENALGDLEREQHLRRAPRRRPWPP